MNRKRLFTLVVAYCVITLVACSLGSLVAPQSALADGNGGIDPPIGRDTLGDGDGQDPGSTDEPQTDPWLLDLLLLYINLMV